MTVIYHWPPVACVSTMWVERQPVRRSVSALTGQRFVTPVGPRRREAQVGISALSRARDGQGYADSLRRLLRSGVNLVRVSSPAANWWMDHRAAQRPGGLRSSPVQWIDGDGSPVLWHDVSGPVTWVNGPMIFCTATTLSGFPAAAVSGLAPGQLVCRAWDVIRVTAGGEDHTARALRTVYADGAGAAVVPLHDPLPAGRISVTDEETAVFEAEIEAVTQPLASNWIIGVTLREVLPSEIPPGAPEVNPWI